jgi:hypothetical protein
MKVLTSHTSPHDEVMVESREDVLHRMTNESKGQDLLTLGKVAVESKEGGREITRAIDLTGEIFHL